MLRKVEDKIKTMEVLQIGMFVLMALIPLVRQIGKAEFHTITLYLGILTLGVMIMATGYIMIFSIEYHVVKYFERLSEMVIEMKNDYKI